MAKKTKKSGVKVNYQGDVFINTNTRWFVDADFDVEDVIEGIPTRSAMLNCLQKELYNDIVDEETLEIIEVGDVDTNQSDENEENDD